jgi:polysaccharide biosynthesis protein PslG
VASATIHARKARALVPALALVATLAFAATAEALPARFWGVVPQSTLSAEQFQRLARGRVESTRVTLDWASLQPRRGDPIAWGGPDAIIERAALAGIEVLPTVTDAPSWAVRSARVPGGGGSVAPAHLPVTGAAAAGWKSLLTQAIERYGPNGEFWATHPSLPVRPIRTWQIWNEPNFEFFVARPNPTEYGKLVKLSHAAIGSADPGAKVVLAGLFAQPKGSRTPSGRHAGLNWFASDFLSRMYKTTPGVKTSFNGAALHPYTSTWQHLKPEIEEVRGVLKSNRDAGKGLWITELGWSSEPASRGDAFAKGPAGQAAQLKGAFTLLRNNQRKWGIQQVDWFSVDDQAGACNFCGGSGLFGPGFTPKPAWRAYVKFTGGTP